MIVAAAAVEGQPEPGGADGLGHVHDVIDAVLLRDASALAVDGVVAAREPLAYTDSESKAHRPAHILLWSADAPDHAELVGVRWSERKAEALLCHSSQGQTTMSDAHLGAAERARFVASLDARHHDAGQVLGVGPAETFKRLTP